MCSRRGGGILYFLKEHPEVDLAGEPAGFIEGPCSTLETGNDRGGLKTIDIASYLCFQEGNLPGLFLPDTVRTGCVRLEFAFDVDLLGLMSESRRGVRRGMDLHA
jgi:hypothetical protein